jgi:hypothetical protein
MSVRDLLRTISPVLLARERCWIANSERVSSAAAVSILHRQPWCQLSLVAGSHEMSSAACRARGLK